MKNKEKEIGNLKALKYSEDRKLNKKITDLQHDLDGQKLEYELLLAKMHEKLDAAISKRLVSARCCYPIDYSVLIDIPYFSPFLSLRT